MTIAIVVATTAEQNRSIEYYKLLEIISKIEETI